MNRSNVKILLFPLLILIGLIGLLVLLAALQYQWLGEISRNERERMEKRLQADSQKFAADFNGEIRRAYFAAALDSEIFFKKDWTEFTKRYRAWQAQTDYPDLIGKFYLLKKDGAPLEYDAAKKEFTAAQTNAELEEISNLFRQEKPPVSFIEPIIKNDYTIFTPLYNGGEITVRSENGVSDIKPKLAGFVVLKLNETEVRRLLSDLTARYFAPDTAYNFNLSIVRESDAADIFKSAENFTAAKASKDFSLPVYDLSVGNFNLTTVMKRSNVLITDKSIVRSMKTPNNEGNKTTSKTKVFIARSDSGDVLESSPLPATNNLRVKVFDDQAEQKREAKGIWRLNVTHSTGSLDEFVTNTRRKNLAVSFGILSLLGASVVLIFLSAQRAKILAQRQVDFVSAVSHEFRTPLAVIYSAGENLADGVAKEEKQISRYGDLIKGEGRKLSKMVEQILDFAGANAGKKKYDFRETNVKGIIENALRECQSLLDEKAFAVEKNITENLPPISADRNALSQAIQNLIVNAVKYSDGEKLLKISAINGGGKIKIYVEDKGIGIAPKDLKHIFEPFYRAKTVVDEQIHGNGLGLNLVKQIVEAHGGAVEVRSAVGEGSEFIIFLKHIET